MSENNTNNIRVHDSVRQNGQQVVWRVLEVTETRVILHCPDRFVAGMAPRLNVPVGSVHHVRVHDGMVCPVEMFPG